MSIFGTIMSKIFGASPAAGGAAAMPAAAVASPQATPSLPAAAPAGVSSTAAPAAPPTAPAAPVDVDAVLTAMQAKSGETLNWKTSIVDLLKLLDLDSSLASRKELAKELNYSGNTDDSATMNIWLHQEVMAKLEENGGKVPADLKA